MGSRSLTSWTRSYSTRETISGNGDSTYTCKTCLDSAVQRFAMMLDHNPAWGANSYLQRLAVMLRHRSSMAHGGMLAKKTSLQRKIEYTPQARSTEQGQLGQHHYNPLW